VLPTDTTMAYVKEHAQYMKRKLNSIPPVRARALAALAVQVAAALAGRDGARAKTSGCTLVPPPPRLLQAPLASRPSALAPPPHPPAPSASRPSPAAPQRPACGLGAWFGAFNTDTQERSCVNRPKAADAFYALQNAATLAAGAYSEEDMKLAQALRAKSTLVFPTEGARPFFFAGGGGARAEWGRARGAARGGCMCAAARARRGASAGAHWRPRAAAAAVEGWGADPACGAGERLLIRPFPPSRPLAHRPQPRAASPARARTSRAARSKRPVARRRRRKRARRGRAARLPGGRRPAAAAGGRRCRPGALRPRDSRARGDPAACCRLERRRGRGLVPAHAPAAAYPPRGGRRGPRPWSAL
jgi:hypothetical protein